jgi:O-antigen/teichoic acid export membrane protein
MFFIGLLLALILLIIAWVYINAFLPIQFRVAFHYFVVLASGIPAVLMAVILHTSLEAHLRYKELTVIGVIPNLLKVLLVILGGYLGGIFGICIGLTIGVWISLVFYYMLTLRLEYVQRIVVKFPFLAKLSEY